MRVFLIALLAAISYAQTELANLQAECQDLSKCPRYYNNTMADYRPGDAISVNEDLASFFKSTFQTYLAMMENEYPPTKLDRADVFFGVAGRAYIYWRLYVNYNDTQYLTKAKAYIALAVENISTLDESQVGFNWGRTGVHCVAAVIFDALQDSCGRGMHVQSVMSIFEEAVNDDYASYDDWDAGRAGLLFAGSFLRSHLPSEAIPETLTQSMMAIAQAIIRRGKENSRNPTKYMEWISPIEKGRWVGQSHGSAGVLRALLMVPKILEDEDVKTSITNTIEHVLLTQFPSGNFPSEYFNDTDDVLVQWDHGAPGVMGMLIDAYRIFGKESYLQAAERAADCVWKRGLVVKGLMLCHGITGNTYMQIYLGKHTGNPKYIWRALQFQRFIQSYPPLWDPSKMRQPTPSPWYFYIGSYESAIPLWADLASFSSEPSNWKMPLYDLGIIPSLL